MFDALTEKLQQTFKRMRNKGRLTEADVKEALREVRLALLEADVNFKVVREFLGRVEARAVGQDVLESLTPDQAVIRIVRDELIQLMGSHVERVHMASNPPTVIYMVGLQGAGKTTASAKLARMLRHQGRQPLLVAADIYRPAAIDQLKVLADKIQVPVVTEPSKTPVELAELGKAASRRMAKDVIIIDTAGRLHVDDDLMGELEAMNARIPANEMLLVVDAMTGQDAVRVAEAFKERLPLTGVVMTKLDGDARGGAALSIREVTQLPIKLVGSGEKLEDLEPFNPDRMASRILGMGDILTLIEKAEASMDREDTQALAEKITKADFTLDDFRAMIDQVKKLGPLSKVMEMMPGMGGKMAKMKDKVDDRSVVRVEAILNSMTKKERQRPEIIDGSRRLRIARGSGTTVQEVNRLLKQFDEIKKMMKQMKGKKGRMRMPRMPFPPLG
ncbi:signal recognition particle protein [Sulfobacillus harzensis]|uniref:Signal recognition particle protein n=1 Tax=Sulfobacillus harzensis TaxID=2729629 RepID=A0A7Y0L6R6_9FIRM|nr:signal recognition particle protein [Sulfobacillus harzensis]NMP22959.1 signal recognition particle protein [Sulfobacillus harzensis]